MLNKWCGIGRFGKDPELKKTTSGKNFCSFDLAVERDYKKNDERETDWLRFVAWENLARFLSQHFKKGDAVYIEGPLQSRMHEFDDGRKIREFEIVVEKVEFLP